MNTSIRVLTPTCTLGYGFDKKALERGLSLCPNVIAVDAGSTDPGPHYLGSGEALVSRVSIKRELSQLIGDAHREGIPLIVGSAGGAGSNRHVDDVVEIAREVLKEQGLSLNLAWIYSDIPTGKIIQSIESDEVVDFEAGFDLKKGDVNESDTVVAQMGYEPIIEALDKGADIIIAGRACDDCVIAAYPIWKGADPGLAVHMGKILECGAFSADPHGADVMIGTIDSTGFTLEPGSDQRRASLSSVAAHTLYERENPFLQAGPGHKLDLSKCTFEQISERKVRVEGSQFTKDLEYWVKLEGVKNKGFRVISIAGIRCPTMIDNIENLLHETKIKAEDYFQSPTLDIQFKIYGKNGVMGELEVNKNIEPHEICVIMEVVDSDKESARAAAHFISGTLLHVSYDGQYNTAGNLAFPYSPSEVNVGTVYEFSIYHLMKAESPQQYFPVNLEKV